MPITSHGHKTFLPVGRTCTIALLASFKRVVPGLLTIVSTLYVASQDVWCLSERINKTPPCRSLLLFACALAWGSIVPPLFRLADRVEAPAATRGGPVSRGKFTLSPAPLESEAISFNSRCAHAAVAKPSQPGCPMGYSQLRCPGVRLSHWKE